MDDLDELIARLNESREHCGMCGEQAVVRNSRDQYICEVCLHETIPTPPYRMRWEAADAIEALQARVTELEAAIAKMDWERPTLAQLSAARNDALDDAARRLLRCFPNMGMIDEFADAIRALKDRNETEPEREPDNRTDNPDNRLDGEREET